MITNKRIGVLAGGTSAEREISLKSGGAINKALMSLGYNVVLIDVSYNLCQSLKTEGVEIAFVALHGGYGENGAVQGLLEVMEIPYTGSGVLASALAMDKDASKKIFLYHNIAVPPFKVITKNEKDSPLVSTLSTSEGGYLLLSELPLPWVVKPATEGSSVGVNIVNNEDEIAYAINSAFSCGHKIIIEKYIKGKEIHIGILGQKILGGVEVKPSREFYNYEAKYTPGLTQYALPPEVDRSAYESLKTVALEAYNALGCRGAARVDLILSESSIPYVFEVNTIPGMTETSLLPKIAGLSKIEFPDLVQEMLKLGIISHE